MSRIFTPNRWYFLTLVLFALGLMAKPMLVTLPVVLLLLDWWPLGRLAGANDAPGRIAWPRLCRLLLEKSPFFLLSLASAAVTVYAQGRGQALQDLGSWPVGQRLAAAVTALGAYLARTVDPRGLAYFYPVPLDGIPITTLLASLAAVLCLTAAVVALRRRAPSLVVGWLWFLVMLLPVLGIVRAGNQMMADRYTYLPLVGVFLAFLIAAGNLARRRFLLRVSVPLAVGAIILLLLSPARRQVMVWRDSLTLYAHAVEVVAGNWPARNAYGVALARRGMIDRAAEQYESALAANPRFPKAHYNLGLARRLQGRRLEGIAHLGEALRLDPGYTGAALALAGFLEEEGRIAEAEAVYRRLLAARPDSSPAREGLAALLRRPADPGKP